MLICPVCHCEHHNINKQKCRNKFCKADLQNPGQIPASRIVKSKIPRNPLLGNTFQELLSEAGAVECLSANIAPPKFIEVPKEDEEVDEPMDEVPDTAEDTRTKAQDILDKLRSWSADPDVIKQQQRVVDALPKPRRTKPTQPILDTGLLHQALSQAIEYHNEVSARTAQAVEQCEQLVKQAQDALDHARQQQQDHKEKSVKQVNELKELIKKKQEQTKTDLALPVTEAQEDQKLLMGELQTYLLSTELPPQLKSMLAKAEIRIGTGPAMSFTIGDNQGPGQSTSEPAEETRPPQAPMQVDPKPKDGA